MKRDRTLFLFAAICMAVRPAASAPRSKNPADLKVDYASFKNPPAEYRGHRWLGLNLSTVTEANIVKMVDDAAKSGVAGSFMMTPDHAATGNLSADYLRNSHRPASTQGVEYLSEEYFRLYRLAVEQGEKSGLPMRVLYDEVQYPTGMAGGLFFSKFPADIAKSLEMIERNVAGPARVELEIPVQGGMYIGAVRMNRDTLARVEINEGRTAKGLSTAVPAGNWKVMLFYLDPTFRPASNKGGFMDYLDAPAVDKFISMTFDAYYAHLKEFFGSTIQMTFYDEPAMHLSNGRMWTGSFNQAFEKKFGFSAMPYYPALFYDIGPETAAARNALFGMRAQMYSENYIGRVAAWCAGHGIDMSGHQDQEETRNPVGIHGDLMKVFEKQQIPGVDDIYYNGRSNPGYKVVTSSAFNWDKPLVMAETYAAYRQKTPVAAYKTAMDQFAMGVNLQIGNRPAEGAQEIDRFIGRMSYLLRHGRHVADIAVLYPIASLQSAYYFAQPPSSNRPGGNPQFYWALEGGLIPPETDYMDLGEMLYRGLRIDYTYLHPEVLAKRTLVENGHLILDNQENREEFRVLILPGGDTLSADAANRILDFYRKGGAVIATRKLPSKSAEFRRDAEVQAMVTEVFGFPVRDPITAEIRPVVDDFKNYFANHNQGGGRAYFLPQPDIKLLNTVLKEAIPARDVDIQEPPMWPVKMATEYEGALTYIHKVKDGKDIYFFANSQDKPVRAKVVLRGDKKVSIWNPHTGERSAAVGENHGSTTTVQLDLDPVKGAFFVQQ